MNTAKRGAECVSDSDNDGNSDEPKSPDSSNSFQSTKRRKMDLDNTILELGYDGSNEELEKLSNRQKKKLIKQLKWSQRRPIKRQLEKEKRKLQLVEKKLNGIQIISRKDKKCNSMKNSNCKVKVVVDLSFDDLMSNKDINKCVQQVNRCYCANRLVQNPLQFYVTSFNGASKAIMAKNDGYKNWDVFFHDESYINLFEKKNLVYLTSDSDNIIDVLADDTVYIIGGLVDHNSYKNVCYRIACDQGIGHGRLPLDKYLDMKTRKVLTINHVFEIMLLVTGGMSWKDAFVKILPQRKGALPKLADRNDDDNMNDNKDGVTNEDKDGDNMNDNYENKDGDNNEDKDGDNMNDNSENKTVIENNNDNNDIM